MVILKAETLAEMYEHFKNKGAVADSIVEGVEKSMQSNSSQATILRCEVEELGHSFDLCLAKSEWSEALQSALEHYEDIKEVDKCIDTWKLLEAVKCW